MKYLLSALVFLFSAKSFSQFGDSLVVRYTISYDCSREIDSKSLRGACGNTETIVYDKYRRKYAIRSFVSKSGFYVWKGRWESTEDTITHEKKTAWKGGFGPNLIEDSVTHPLVLRHRKLRVKTLEDFLKEISTVQSDTIFPYSVQDVSAKFLRKIGAPEGGRDSVQMDSLVHDSFYVLAMSTVTGYLSFSFQFQGKQVYLSKDTNNPYWRVYFPEKEEEAPVKVIYFALDAFLKENLPPKFSGKRALNE
ncbi:hypothetical protein [Fluviicola sp.]|uniref:hypothetical protein n=1 Tax=Fluviicola sp. TaxID=1917219 RepID=UPI0031DCDA76